MQEIAQQLSDPTIRTILLVAALAIAIFLICLIAARWLKPTVEGTPELSTPNDLLSEFRRLRAEGAMTEVEFERVKRKLANQIRAQAGQPPMKDDNLPPLPESDEETEFEWKDVDLKKLQPPT